MDIFVIFSNYFRMIVHFELRTGFMNIFVIFFKYIGPLLILTSHDNYVAICPTRKSLLLCENFLLLLLMSV